MREPLAKPTEQKSAPARRRTPAPEESQLGWRATRRLARQGVHLRDGLGNQAMLRLLRGQHPPRGCSGCGGAAPCTSCGGRVAVGASHAPEESQADAFATAVAGGAPASGSGGTRPARIGREGLLGGAGAPIAEGAREQLEEASGADLGGVRVHTDATTARAADSLGARAFNLGRDIGFATGEYQPDTSEGLRVLAHETAHVLQGGATLRKQDAPAPVRQASDAGPCAILSDQLDNSELLFQLNRARVYLYKRKRGEDQFYDYANLLRRLSATRYARVSAGQVWLSEPGLYDIPAELYRLRQGSAALQLVIERATPASVLPAIPTSSDTVLTGAQLQRFLAREGLPTIDAPSYFAARDPNSSEPMRVDLPVRPRRAYVVMTPHWQDGRFQLQQVGKPIAIGNVIPPPGGYEPPNPYSSLDLTTRIQDFLTPSGPYGMPAAGVRETTFVPPVSWSLNQLNASPSGVTTPGDEKIYLPAAPAPSANPMQSYAPSPWNGFTNDPPQASIIPGAAAALSPLAFPGPPLREGTTGFMWEGSHTSDFVVIGGRLYIRGFRASLYKHGMSGRERALSKKIEGDSGGYGTTAELNRGTPGTYANDTLFPYFEGATAIVRADGTPISADEVAQLMARTTVRLKGEPYLYSNPPEGSRAFKLAFPDGKAGKPFNCINAPMDVHNAAVGTNDVVVLTQDGPQIIRLADPAHASAANMKSFMQQDAYLAQQGLRSVPLTSSMRKGLAMSTGAGVGMSLFGNLVSAAQGGETHFVRDAGVSLVTTPVTTIGEQYAVSATTNWLLQKGMSVPAAGVGGRFVGSTGVAVIAAPAINSGVMALEELFTDKDYTGIDYLATGGRSLVSAAGGAATGALAAGGVGALAGSEFPIVGNAVGFVVGVGGYYLTDWLVGDDVEDTIREGMGEYGCTDGVGPGR